MDFEGACANRQQGGRLVEGRYVAGIFNHIELHGMLQMKWFLY
jgi:hypothetical protein